MKIFATLDIDNDGDVMEEEFVQGCLKDEQLVILHPNILKTTELFFRLKRVKRDPKGPKNRLPEPITCGRLQKVNFILYILNHMINF